MTREGSPRKPLPRQVLCWSSASSQACEQPRDAAGGYPGAQGEVALASRKGHERSQQTRETEAANRHGSFHQHPRSEVLDVTQAHAHLPRPGAIGTLEEEATGKHCDRADEAEARFGLAQGHGMLQRQSPRRPHDPQQLEAAAQDLTTCIEHGYELEQTYYQRAQVYGALGESDKQASDLENSLKNAR